MNLKELEQIKDIFLAVASLLCLFPHDFFFRYRNRKNIKFRFKTPIDHKINYL